MATKGFEFAYMLDGSNSVPVVRDFTLGTAAAHLVGDLMLIASDEAIDAEADAIDEVTCIMMEAVASADVTADTTVAKAAVITRNQVWKCSTDATTAATAFESLALLDIADKNTIDADDVTNGSMVVVENDTKKLDDDGNLILYVAFTDTTWGNP